MTRKAFYDLDGVFDPSRGNPADAHWRIVNMVPPGSRVLEVGCSTGYLSAYLESEKGCQVTGVEINPQAASVAIARCTRVVIGNIEDPDVLGAVRGEYDVLLLAAVLEHLVRPERTLEKLVGFLSDSGVAVISLPNVAHWSVRLNLLRGRFEYQDYGVMDRTHLHFYTMQSAISMIENCGLVVKDIEIAGSAIQNLIERIGRRLGIKAMPLLLPGLLGYEFIFRATVRT